MIHKCDMCGTEHGRMKTYYRGGTVTLCSHCSSKRRVEARARINAPAVHGDFNGYFNWQLGKHVATRSDERQIEKEHGAFSFSDASAMRDELGISEAENEQNIETTKRETIARDRDLSRRIIDEHARRVQENPETPWGSPVVEEAGPDPDNL